jgi:hypothetical protein
VSCSECGKVICRRIGCHNQKKKAATHYWAAAFCLKKENENAVGNGVFAKDSSF